MARLYFPRAIGVLIITACFSCNAENHGASSLNQQPTRPVVTPETKTTKMADGTVVTWTRVTEEELKQLGIKDPKAFGEAWKDPSGMIWGDISMKDGSPLFMSYEDAEAYCKKLGAELPSGYPEGLNGKDIYPKKDSDITRLFKYSAKREGMLPHLPYENKPGFYQKPGVTEYVYNWSSSPLTDDLSFAYGYNGSKSYFVYDGFNNEHALIHGMKAAVARCVVR